MKYALIITLLFIFSGCSSSSSESSENELVGEWLSNCYQRTDNNGVFIAYAISHLSISGTAFVSTAIEYTDINCTMPNGSAIAMDQEYALGELVTTTDGTTARRITLTSDFNFAGQPVKMTIENIYRIAGVELNFGDYISGQTPSLDYSVTYLKQ